MRGSPGVMRLFESKNCFVPGDWLFASAALEQDLARWTVHGISGIRSG